MLIVAVVLVLFARDAWHWQRAIQDADTRASLGYISPTAWSAKTTLPGSWVRGALGVNDDLAFRTTAIESLRELAHPPTLAAQKHRTVVETALARITRAPGPEARAASAADDLGVLLYFDPPTPSNAANPYQNPNQAAPSGAQTPTQKALAQFLLAVRLDPSDAIAQRNLEALLRASSTAKPLQTPRTGAGERLGAKGSGSRQPGHGY
jgi:hypothetical protein